MLSESTLLTAVHGQPWHQLATLPCLSAGRTRQPTCFHRQYPEHACPSGTQAPSTGENVMIVQSHGAQSHLQNWKHIKKELHNLHTLVLNNVTFCITKNIKICQWNAKHLRFFKAFKDRQSSLRLELNTVCSQGIVTFFPCCSQT